MTLFFSAFAVGCEIRQKLDMMIQNIFIVFIDDKVRIIRPTRCIMHVFKISYRDSNKSCYLAIYWGIKLKFILEFLIQNMKSFKITVINVRNYLFYFHIFV